MKIDLDALLAWGVKDLWISFEELGILDKIFYAGDATIGDLNVIIFNPIVSTILK
jgi:hypothetical protein